MLLGAISKRFDTIVEFTAFEDFISFEKKGENMKLPTSIENILNENIVENARLELKKNWNPEPILHTICAFANDIDNWGGGYIIIGVEEENGRPKMPITGLEIHEIDRIQKELLSKCKLIQPSYTPIVDVAQYKGKNILIVWCFGGKQDHISVQQH